MARDTIYRLTTQHLERFPAAAPRFATPATVDREEIRRQAVEWELRDLHWYQRKARRLATEQALAAATELIAQREEKAQASAMDAQAAYDLDWSNLLRGDPLAATERLERAFRRADYPTRVVEVVDGYALLAVTIPGEGVLPVKMPGTTPAGNVSLRKMTKDQRIGLYQGFVASSALASALRAFAAAPGLEEVEVTVHRLRGFAFSGGSGEAILRADMSRSAMEIDWSGGDPWSALQAAGRVRYMCSNSSGYFIALAQ